ncbi:MAG: thioredoxin family protein, partial [Planctomycetota bacterium]
PILGDYDGKVGQKYGAKTTPHMFVIDRQGRIAYQGGIDNDPRGNKPDDQTVNYVDQALQQLTEGQQVEQNQAKPYGCSVKYAE